MQRAAEDAFQTDSFEVSEGLSQKSVVGRFIF